MYANFKANSASRIATVIAASLCAFTTISSGVAMLTVQALPV